MPKNRHLFHKLLKVLSSRVVYTILSLVMIVVGSHLAIQYARGSWRVSNSGIIANTGLLNANSFPAGAQVFINDKLVTATDDTVYLQPGIYRIKIVKEGYSPWAKNLTIHSQLVTQTNALLFPIASSITPLTFTGATNIYPSPDGQKILFFTEQADSTLKSGLYILDLNSNFLSLQSGPKQISDNPDGWNLATANVIWSPDSNELAILTENHEVLIGIDKKVNLSEQKDISFQKTEILSAWEKDIYLRERQFLAKFPEEIQLIATQAARNIYISPDKKRLLYTATAAATLTENIVPPVPATNTQPEERQLEIDGVYVYDREEDKNFRITTAHLATEAAAITNQDSKYLLHYTDLATSQSASLASLSTFNSLQASSSATTAMNFANYYTGARHNSMQWFPNSKNILFISDNKIKIMEYDGYNVNTVYSGPFANNFLYPWPDGSKLIIQTSFSPDSPHNLYAIDLRK